MAKIGLRYPTVKTLTGTPKTATIGKAVTANISITASDVKQYGDDGVAESDRGFQDGTVDLTTTELSAEHNALLLGHKITEEGELIANAEDIPPYVMFGFCAAKRVDGKNKYRAIILQKVQFGEPNDEHKTKGENLEFGDSSISGTILVDESGNWKKEQTFDTFDLAKSYINTALGIVETPVG